MFESKKTRPVPAAALAGVMMLVLPVAVSSQEQVSPAQPSAEVQGWLTELGEIETRLGPLQAEAMQDAALREEQEEVSRMVQAAMESSPQLQNLPERAADIQARAQAAQEAGNEQQLQGVLQEAQALEREVATAQEAVLQQPEIAARTEALQARLISRMVEIDPSAEIMIQRYGELQRRLMAAFGES